eukprot:1370984-Amorphochlora_amoeboformis.AAC.1
MYITHYPSAGDKFEICIEAENSAGTFGWYFVSEGDYDVGFSVTVEEKDGKIEPRKFNKIIADKGSYTSKGPCVVRIVWDNSYSLFTSKTIKYYASVSCGSRRGLEFRPTGRSIKYWVPSSPGYRAGSISTRPS